MNRYFTIVKDPGAVKPGDILVWKKETGKVPKLHLSPASMRQFGISIGRRWKALSYDQVEMLVRHPEFTRYYIVTSVINRSLTMAERALTFSNTDETLQQAVLTEFPMDPAAARRGAYGSEHGHAVYDAFLKNSVDRLCGLLGSTKISWSGVIGSTPRDNTVTGSSAEHRFSSDEVLLYLVGDADYYRSHPVFSGPARTPCTSYGTDEFSIRRLYRTEDGGMSARALKDIAKAVCGPYGPGELRRSALDFKYDIPADFLVAATDRGAVLLRPTEEFWKYWTAKFVQTVEEDMQSAYTEISGRLSFMAAETAKCLKLVKGRQAKLVRDCARHTKTGVKLEKEVSNELGKF